MRFGPVIGRAIAGIAVMAAAMTPASTASASCVGARLSVTPLSASPGDLVEVTGEYFGTACNDQGGGARVLGDPQSGIELDIAQAGKATRLLLVDADSQYKFVVRLALPHPLVGGSATFSALSSEHLLVTTDITVTGGGSSNPSPPPTVLVGRISTGTHALASSSSRWPPFVFGILVGGVCSGVIAWFRGRGLRKSGPR